MDNTVLVIGSRNLLDANTIRALEAQNITTRFIDAAHPAPAAADTARFALVAPSTVPAANLRALFSAPRTPVLPSACLIILDQSNSEIHAFIDCGIRRFAVRPWSTALFTCIIQDIFEMQTREAERKKLIEELAAKGEDLKKLNNSLEEKVEKRSEIIRAQNLLLNMLVEGKEPVAVMREACEIAREFAGSEKVYLFSEALDGKWVGTQEEVPRSVEEQIAKMSQAEDCIFFDEFALIPLKQNDTFLGVLILDSIKSDHEQVSLVEKNLAPIVALAVMQHKLLANAPQLLNDIDTLMKAF
jgi:hypothetical protein